MISNIRQRPFFQLFTVYTRYLIGSAFVIAAFGMGKVGNSFPILSQDNSAPNTISHLFATFTNSGLYWQFIGWTQILGGLLLITQRYARLGALIFLPVITNIFIITLSYHFRGTPVITGLMLLANIYLVVWEYDYLKFIFITPKSTTTIESAPLKVADLPIWSITGLIIFVTIVVLSLIKFHIFLIMLIALAEGVIAFFIFIFLALRKKHS